jgi:hypothetical protein
MITCKAGNGSQHRGQVTIERSVHHSNRHKLNLSYTEAVSWQLINLCSTLQNDVTLEITINPVTYGNVDRTVFITPTNYYAKSMEDYFSIRSAIVQLQKIYSYRVFIIPDYNAASFIKVMINSDNCSMRSLFVEQVNDIVHTFSYDGPVEIIMDGCYFTCQLVISVESKGCLKQFGNRYHTLVEVNLKKVKIAKNAYINQELRLYERR